jgi:hypothetical protein
MDMFPVSITTILKMGSLEAVDSQRVNLSSDCFRLLGATLSPLPGRRILALWTQRTHCVDLFPVSLSPVSKMGSLGAMDSQQPVAAQVAPRDFTNFQVPIGGPSRLFF